MSTTPLTPRTPEAPGAPAPARASIIPELLAFGLSLVFAAIIGWNTSTLVWSLWATSLVIGYAIVVSHIICFSRANLAYDMAKHPAEQTGEIPPSLLIPTLLSGLFLLVFFTFHFGMFHFVHSFFLNHFFPVTHSDTLSLRDYIDVIVSCLLFFPMALIAERATFKRIIRESEKPLPPQARQGRMAKGMISPYKNVIRLHMLIFFFGFAYAIGLGDFWIFLTVYCLYFFPWNQIPFLRKLGEKFVKNVEENSAASAKINGRTLFKKKPDDLDEH